VRICGLDPSLTNTGIAILEARCSECGSRGCHELWPQQRKCCPDCRCTRPVQPVALHSIGWGEDGGKSYVERNRRGRSLASSVMQYVIDRSPDLVIIEAPIPRGLNRSNQPDLWWLFGLLLAECDIRKLESVIVNPRIRQAWPTGNGNAGKPEILEEVRRWWGGAYKREVRNADIADACVLACIAALRYGYPMPFSPVKQRHWTPLLEKVVWPASAPAAPEQPEQLRLA